MVDWVLLLLLLVVKPLRALDLILREAAHHFLEPLMHADTQIHIHADTQTFKHTQAE